jgi:hypothetical protein
VVFFVDEVINRFSGNHRKRGYCSQSFISTAETEDHKMLLDLGFEVESVEEMKASLN